MSTIYLLEFVVSVVVVVVFSIETSLMLQPEMIYIYN